MYQSILTEIDNSVAILTLNRPERHNALDEPVVAEITQALTEFENDQHVRTIVISSSGRSFCAGSDIDWIKRIAASSMHESQSNADNVARLFSTLNALSKPTVARVQGSAFGSGIGLIAACDIAVATYDAQFALTEVRLGLLPALVSPYVVATIGERQCRRYMLSGERFSAGEAYRIGLINEIVPDEEQLDDAIGEIVDSLLKGSPAALAACKALIRAISGQPIDASTVEETVQRHIQIRHSRDGDEGLAAFLEKRKPDWAE